MSSAFSFRVDVTSRSKANSTFGTGQGVAGPGCITRTNPKELRLKVVRSNGKLLLRRKCERNPGIELTVYRFLVERRRKASKRIDYLLVKSAPGIVVGITSPPFPYPPPTTVDVPLPTNDVSASIHSSRYDRAKWVVREGLPLVLLQMTTSHSRASSHSRRRTSYCWKDASKARSVSVHGMCKGWSGP